MGTDKYNREWGEKVVGALQRAHSRNKSRLKRRSPPPDRLAENSQEVVCAVRSMAEPEAPCYFDKRALAGKCRRWRGRGQRMAGEGVP